MCGTRRREWSWGKAGGTGDIEGADINALNIRLLQRDEIPLIWQIDRREIVENIYVWNDGKLVLKRDYFDIKGWPPGEAELYTPVLLDCYDRSGSFWGTFEETTLVGVAVLESKFIGSQQDTLQLKFLHVSRDCRKKGMATKLFHLAVEKASSLGAQKLYISATPSENTVNYYLRRGCTLATELDPELFALEPEDIHLHYVISKPA
ncbi:MAG TPA: GNAT family N-acetyltransferase [Anaerolineales bacterium]|nr:GNAT family N-acetyltransferase [Anaerolineales bacterium]